ncbi:uncharacterized protein LOC123317623 [Coccinella septempunctata]|uniref:uncharacterized protein LOC123317623 n=1 Tax=Coccinella septempunctata TaxID=41139 RepID=UPI001D06F3BC|nr:uncharacterized protein LOC123317623 [Coccinella septempunctata]
MENKAQRKKEPSDITAEKETENYNKSRYISNNLQEFICEIHRIPGIFDGNAARLQLFLNNYSVSNINKEFNPKNLKNFDASILPPCETELFQQFPRANYIANIWNEANEKQPSIFTPENNGWTFEENQYHFHWFVGDQFPGDVSESLQKSEEAASNDNMIDDVEDDDSNAQYHDWLDDENCNDCVDDNDD